MPLLLDTHALLWFFSGDTRLPTARRDEIRALRTTVYVSVASAWEMAIKAGLGKLELGEPVEQWFTNRLHSERLNLLSISLPHVFEAGSLPLHHRDPFDRMLVAQARVEGLTLVSKDDDVQRYDVPLLWS